MPSRVYYTSPNGLRVPINYRLYDKTEGKTKNQYFQEMWREVRQWGLRPRAVTSDTWYAAKANLNLLKDDHTGFLVGVAKNRLVRCTTHQSYKRVDTLSIPDAGMVVYLKGVGRVRVFCQRFKNESCRHYALYWPDSEALATAGAADYELHRQLYQEVARQFILQKPLTGAVP